MVRGSRSVHDGWVRNLKGDFTLVAYEFYIPDSHKGPKLIGILPERRRDPRRITKESIMKWGEKVIENHMNIKDLFFVRVTIDNHEPELNLHP